MPKTTLICNILNGSNWCRPHNSSQELLEIQISMSNIVPNTDLDDMIMDSAAPSIWDRFWQFKPNAGWSKLVRYNQNIFSICVSFFGWPLNASFVLWIGF